MTKTIDALTSFKISEKPPESAFKKRGKFDKIILALANLSNEKAIELELDMLGTSPKHFIAALRTSGRKHKLNIHGIEKSGKLFVWTNA